MKPQMRKTPSYLKGLAETRARADADVQRLQKIHDEVAEKLAEAQAERDSCDRLIRKYDERLDPNLIAPIRAQKGRYGEHGQLTRIIVSRLETAWPDSVSTQELAWAIQMECQLDFMTKVARYEWVRNSVRRKLNILVSLGAVERLHEVAKGAAQEHGQWRWKPQAGVSLDELLAAAKSNGVGAKQAKARGRPAKPKPVEISPMP